MPRVTVELVDLYCTDTEDITGADKVFLAGGVTDGTVTRAVLTKPIRISDGETKTFSAEESVIFDALVPQGMQVGVSLTAIEEDAAKDWGRHEDWVSALQATLDGGVGPRVDVPGVLLEIARAAQGAGTWMPQADRDDVLGTDNRTLAVTPGVQIIDVSYAGRLIRWFSDWQYRLRYQVTVNPGYRLANRHSGQVIEVASKDVGTTARQWTDHGDDNQRFDLTGAGEPGDFKITALHSGLCLHVEESADTADLAIVQGPWAAAEHQKWQIQLGPRPLLRFVHKASARALAVKDDSTSVGAALVLTGAGRGTDADASQWWSCPELWQRESATRRRSR